MERYAVVITKSDDREDGIGWTKGEFLRRGGYSSTADPLEVALYDKPGPAKGLITSLCYGSQEQERRDQLAVVKLRVHYEILEAITGKL